MKRTFQTEVESTVLLAVKLFVIYVIYDFIHTQVTGQMDPTAYQVGLVGGTIIHYVFLYAILPMFIWKTIKKIFSFIRKLFSSTVSAAAQ